MGDGLVGKAVVVKPTQGVYQGDLCGVVVRGTATRVIVRVDGMYLWTFRKCDGLRLGYQRNEFPRYQVVLD